MSDQLTPEIQEHRKPNTPIHNLLLNRWSPRVMSGEEMTDEELRPLFEAARWAPSSYNAQPWRFLYAKKSSSHWQTFFDLMVPQNQEWAQKASALVVVISRSLFERNSKPSKTHSFDSGAAWMSLALEGSHRGYVTHGLEGFDYEKARSSLNIPDEFQVEAMIVIGKRVPETDSTRASESPNQRRPLEEILHEGPF